MFLMNPLRTIDKVVISTCLHLFLTLHTLGIADDTVKVKAYFGKTCEKVLINELERARKEIKIAIYSMTRRNIGRAICDASKRGVAVHLKYDESSADWKGMKNSIGYMKRRDVNCESIQMTGKYAKMHHKFCIIDGKRVLTGSYNYTTSATEYNYENLVIIESPEIAGEFIKEFDRIKSK